MGPSPASGLPRACGKVGTDHILKSIDRIGGRPAGQGRSVKALSRKARIAPAGGYHWVPSRFPRGMLNVRTMSQPNFRSEPSLPAALTVYAARSSNNDEHRPGGTGPTTSVITKVKPKTKRPNLYRVLIQNDDYTPMEFVVLVLEKFFQKDVEAATKIMLHVHHHGIGECGVFTYEIAETKVTQVMDFARKHQHPLQCVMEKK